MGIAGAALASVIAYGSTFAAGLWIFFAGRSNVRLHLRGELPISAARMGRMLKISAPAGVGSLSFALGRTVVLPWIAAFGTQVVAAFGMAQRVMGFGIMLIVGMGLGLSALIGQTLGAGKLQRTWETAVRSVQFSGGAMAVYGALLMLGAPAIAAAFFGGGPEASIAVTTLRIIAVALPFQGVGIMFEMTCSGAGETRVPLAFNRYLMPSPLAAGLGFLALLSLLLPGGSSTQAAAFNLFIRSRHCAPRTRTPWSVYTSRAPAVDSGSPPKSCQCHDRLRTIAEQAPPGMVVRLRSPAPDSVFAGHSQP
ncbi:MAG: hypothetical protein H6694_09035 [Candidatus Latescibacteria bacterium]|nr:hypothetical protein [Candidatus Latescibacterota bacterium]